MEPYKTDQGEFRRKASVFRNQITTDPKDPFPAETGRYHLYVSLACPWAHRTLIVRELKGLQDAIGVTVTNHFLDANGWSFPQKGDALDVPGATPDEVNGAKLARELYQKADPQYDGRVTVPILWDKKKSTIVNNESAEIIRMFNESFDAWAKRPGWSLYPEAMRASIDDVNAWVYELVNNGVYRAGFATTQEAYERNCKQVFEGLDQVEAILARQEWLCDGGFSEADVRLFTTVLRFDPVYHTHFKCNVRTIASDYPSILRWLRRVYQLPGISGTVNMEHIKRHYFCSHRHINPTGIFALNNGPVLDAPAAEYVDYPLALRS